MTDNAASKVEALLAAKDLSGAQKLCLEVLKEKQVPALSRLLGEMAFERGDNPEARRRFLDAATACEEERQLIWSRHRQSFIGELQGHMNSGDKGNIIVMASFISAFQPRDPEALKFVARLFIKLKRLSQARETLEKLQLQLMDPEPLAETRALLVDVLLMEGNNEEAVHMAREAVAALPFWPSTYHNVLATALDAAGRTAEAQLARQWSQRHEAFCKRQRDEQKIHADMPDEPAKEIESSSIWPKLIRPSLWWEATLLTTAVYLLFQAAI